jgi:hypothetical protein
VAVTTNITDLHAFLQHIITHTNMTCLNAADDALVRTCTFIATLTHYHVTWSAMIAFCTPIPGKCFDLAYVDTCFLFLS